MIALPWARVNPGSRSRQFVRSVGSALVNQQCLVETVQLEHSHYSRVDTGKPEPCTVFFRHLISRDEAGHAGAVYVCNVREINEDATTRTDVLKEPLQDRTRVIEI